MNNLGLLALYYFFIIYLCWRIPILCPTLSRINNFVRGMLIWLWDFSKCLIICSASPTWVKSGKLGFWDFEAFIFLKKFFGIFDYLLAIAWSSRIWQNWLWSPHRASFGTLKPLFALRIFLEYLIIYSPSLGRAESGKLGFWSRHRASFEILKPLFALKMFLKYLIAYSPSLSLAKSGKLGF